MKTNSSCVFCDIVDGASSADIVHRWRDSLAFRPLNPVTPGHILVVPVEHVADFSVSPFVSALTMASAAELAHELGGAYNLITSKGEAATQSVFHLHVHLIPRFEKDGLVLPWTGQGK